MLEKFWARVWKNLQPECTSPEVGVSDRPIQLSRWRRPAALMLVGILSFTLILRTGDRPAYSRTAPYCRTPDDAAKTTLRQAAAAGDTTALQRYSATVAADAAALQQCRAQAWPRHQAIWLRLYPCDARPGVIDEVLDHIVDLGYDQVYLEAFYNGQVLLPVSDNTTAWPSVVRQPGYESADLLAQTIAKGHERGLQVYAWMFTMNFGYSYATRNDAVLARNGRGETSISAFEAARRAFADANSSEEVFIDPYSTKAKQDYYLMAQAIARRQPDGMLFDYVRYPRGFGGKSVASQVQDLWIYGEAARTALLERAINPSGKALIEQFLEQGYITATEVTAAQSQFSEDILPQWQGQTLPADATALPVEALTPLLQQELWNLGVGHATQGVLDFLAVARLAAEQAGMPTGAVFFPNANAAVNQGYDSRLQPWDRFPATMEWHPMAYGACGDASCVLTKIQRVLDEAPAANQVMPVLAGAWGRPLQSHAPLEAQMNAIRQAMPQLQTVSHFAYSWQVPERDGARRFCRF
ncbi:MAG: hypothetical protein AAF289_11140 [Cyanobacteria bacterium P01_A01_bin.135]